MWKRKFTITDDAGNPVPEGFYLTESGQYIHVDSESKTTLGPGSKWRMVRLFIIRIIGYLIGMSIYFNLKWVWER